MNKLILIFSCLISGLVSQAQLLYTLSDIIDRAKTQSPAAKQTETRKENRYWQYRSFRSNYNPQLALNGNLPGYTRDFLQNRLDDGTISFIDREQTTSSLNLGLFQPIGLTGGNISVNSRVIQFNDVTRKITQYNTTLVNIELEQPLIGFNQLKWDKRTEPIRFEESKREFVEEMEAISNTAVSLFFDYLDAQVNLQIALFNLANNDTVYRIENGRYNIGTTSEDKLLQVELQLLRSQQDVEQAKLDLQTARLALRTFIGINEDIEFDVMLPETLPILLLSEAEALDYAKANRADYLAFERRKIEAEREVARARAQQFQTNLTASFGLNSAGTTLDDTYNDPNNQQRLNLSLNLPLVTWGRNQARNYTAQANKKLTDYVIAQEEQNFEQEIITLVKQFEVLKTQIEISKKTDQVAQKRYEVAQNRYLIGKIDITNLNIALTEKDSAKRSYLNALRSYWQAYYNLRRLTLFDFASNQLLYQGQ